MHLPRRGFFFWKNYSFDDDNIVDVDDYDDADADEYGIKTNWKSVLNQNCKIWKFCGQVIVRVFDVI